MISGPGYSFDEEHEVLEKRELGDTILVVYDYMDYPQKGPIKNLVAYDREGKIKWVADSPGNPTSAYCAISSVDPLVVNSFCSHACTIDKITGKIIGKQFFK
jgi:hypothetical protein